MKKMLMLNGSHSELSLIEEAHKLGYYVITTGNNPNLPGHKKADKYVEIDYSDYQAVLDAFKNEKIESVVSCANDFGAITASYIAEKLGLSGHDSFETTCLLHQKDRFKEFALKNGLKVANSVTYSNEEEAIKAAESTRYPSIIKPVDLTGGKGVSKVENAHEYLKAVKDAFEKSRKKVIVVEDYIVGTYHSFSTFIVDKKVVAHFSDNEYSYLNPYFVATSAGPADCVSDVQDLLIEQAEKIAELLNLVNGVFHMQYVMDTNKVPYIMDITRRCSGDLYPEPVEHSTGVPWSKWIIMAESGCSSDIFTERGEQKKYCGRHCIMSSRNGKVKAVHVSDDIKGNIYKKVVWGGKGSIINNYMADKIGVVFYEFETREEMLDKVKRINELIKVEME